MGQKDLAEKQFLSFEDVFADIFNSIVLKQELIDPKKLSDTKTETQLPDLGDELHAQLRDVAKIYADGKVRLALLGIENQTKSDRLMAARVMAYNATAIIDQLKAKDRSQLLYPILTIVLYFGKEKWKAEGELADLFDLSKLPVPKEYLPHQRILVVDVAGLGKEEIARMKSDFKYVAEMMVHKRENADYQPSKVELRHWSEFLRLMDQLDRDYLQKFIEAMTRSNKREGAKMIGYLDEIEAKGEAKGIAKGKAEGKILGAVRVMIKYKVQPDEIRKNISEDYPDFDQSKLDDIIAEQKKELGIS